MSNLKKYKFPTQNLKTPTSEIRSVKSVVLIACGSFNPMTNLHLSMFEGARDFLRDKYKINVIAGYVSPVHDSYKKKGLLHSKHRIPMCKLALESSDWITLDTWEVEQKEFSRTRVVLTHFVKEIKQKLGEKVYKDNVRISLLCGADLLASFVKSGVWREEDVEYILSNHGVICCERKGFSINQLIFQHDILHNYSNNIIIIPSFIENDVSSTKIRRMIKREYSTKYFIADKLRAYIEKHGLYKGDIYTHNQDISIFSKPFDLKKLDLEDEKEEEEEKKDEEKK